jgi:hypothetical protein
MNIFKVNYLRIDEFISPNLFNLFYFILDDYLLLFLYFDHLLKVNFVIVDIFIGFFILPLIDLSGLYLIFDAYEIYDSFYLMLLLIAVFLYRCFYYYLK